jgi:hypothetical protein
MAVAAETKRSAQVQAADPPSPDLVVVALAIESQIQLERIEPRLLATCEAPACAEASLTYLHTLRLRL